MSQEKSTRKPNPGQFRKGNDPRRHQCTTACTHPRHRFTSDECSKGFWRAVESIVTRYPDAILPDGRHMVVNFLKRKTGVAA